MRPRGPKTSPVVAIVLERLVALLAGAREPSRGVTRQAILAAFAPAEGARVMGAIVARPELFERCGHARYRIRPRKLGAIWHANGQTTNA